MNRRAQDQVLRDWEALKRRIADLDKLIIPVLVRGTYDSGIRRSRRVKNDTETGTPPPYYADETGEQAVREAQADRVHDSVLAMVTNVTYALNAAKQVLHVAPQSVAERAMREIPNCAACGDPIVGRICYGRWDNKCRLKFQRWVAAGNPPDEKLRFEHIVQAEQEQLRVARRGTESEWRIVDIDALQRRNELPGKRITSSDIPPSTQDGW